MRILLVIPSITNYFTFLDELTLTLMQAGHEVALAASPRHFDAVKCYDEAPRCDFFPIELPQAMSPLSHLKAARMLHKIVTDYKPDIVHCHTAAGIFTTSLASRFKGRIGVKYIATHHGMVYPLIAGLKRVLIGIAERWSLRQLHAVILLNKSDKEALAAWGIERNIHLYHRSKGIGCRIDQFSHLNTLESSRRALRTSLGIGENDFVFIYVGRQVWFKGFDVTVRAFLALADHYPHAKLLLLGEPYKVHPTGLDQTELSVMLQHPRILRIGWVKAVEQYLSISHVNVFPSEREGMPVNLMESIAMGVPVITRNSRGCNEIVEHGKSGFLLETGDAKFLMERMAQCIDEPETLSKMSRYCLAVRERFDRRIWVEEQIEFYLKIGNGEVRLDT